MEITLGGNHEHEHTDERETLSGVWSLEGTSNQNRIVQDALDLCDFPFEKMSESLAKEGKQAVAVTWEDLSRYSTRASGSGDHDHEDDSDHHVKDENGHEASLVEREIDGRKQVLGLFYLPPYTSVVLDVTLENYEALAREVFLAEGAHAVDYHYMNNDMRVAVWNALHSDAGDLEEGTHVPESFDIHHGHSWFDGPAGYSTWVGEGFMAAFTKAFAPEVDVTIELAHTTSQEGAQSIREALLGVEEIPEPAPVPVPEEEVTPEPEPIPTPEEEPDPSADKVDQDLAKALRRILDNVNCPKYLTEAGNNWLNSNNL